MPTAWAPMVGRRAIERVHRHGEALADLAEAPCVGHAAVVESHDAGRRALDAELVLELVDVHAPLGLGQEAGDALVAIVGGAGEHGVEVADARRW